MAKAQKGRACAAAQKPAFEIAPSYAYLSFLSLRAESCGWGSLFFWGGKSARRLCGYRRQAVPLYYLYFFTFYMQLERAGIPQAALIWKSAKGLSRKEQALCRV